VSKLNHQKTRKQSPGLPDENFNKKPNSANKGQKKAKPIVFMPEKSQTLFVVFLFLCHEKSKLQNIIRNFLRILD